MGSYVILGACNPAWPARPWPPSHVESPPVTRSYDKLAFEGAFRRTVNCKTELAARSLSGRQRTSQISLGLTRSVTRSTL